MGPDRTGAFIQVAIKSIESRRVPQSEVRRGQSATFAIRTVNRKIVLKKSSFRKGMVLVDGLVVPSPNRTGLSTEVMINPYLLCTQATIRTSVMFTTIFYAPLSLILILAPIL